MHLVHFVSKRYWNLKGMAVVGDGRYLPWTVPLLPFSLSPLGFRFFLFLLSHRGLCSNVKGIPS